MPCNVLTEFRGDLPFIVLRAARLCQDNLHGEAMGLMPAFANLVMYVLRPL